MKREITLEGRVVVWKGKVISVSIPFQTYRYRGEVEGSPFVSDCVALRLASHGQTRQEADLSMRNMIRAFLDELMRMGTLDEFLHERGWKREITVLPSGAGRRQAGRKDREAVAWVPPQVVSQIASVSMGR